jgi:hypothetical protein
MLYSTGSGNVMRSVREEPIYGLLAFGIVVRSVATGVSGVQWSHASSAAAAATVGAEPQARGRIVGYCDST